MGLSGQLKASPLDGGPLTNPTESLSVSGRSPQPDKASLFSRWYSFVFNTHWPLY